ncbi:arsenate reductase [Chlorella sorokiniana]|uniref:Arsenate reductase n=1 Tax=Chlorella sorokiniana TaxID=3076 RepID=A0A2P6TQH4_CHLSO|nr:arsenate reductase [Chlorella sorokiniana]|eukprot:PRW56284.1 arsenate reductase [Chlorella sorokiniana]
MTAIAAAVLLALAALAVPALAVPAARGPDAYLAAPGKAASPCQAVTPQEVEQLLETVKWRYLDVRTSKEFVAGHVRGAAANVPFKLPAGNGTLVPNPDFVAQVEQAFPCRRTRIIVACRAGTRSTPACAQLAEAGYHRTLNMPAGYDGWVAAGLPALLMARLRLCLAVECTAKAGAVWPTTLQHVVEPLLALAEASGAGGAAPGLQLALVLFGALPPHSGAAVESVLGWCTSLQHFRRLLDSLEFVGGGGRQPVMLAHALAEAAGLFAAAEAGGGGDGPWQQHCLVCLASEPAVQPVSWPFAEDCCMARLPGMATSLELVRALQRRGLQLSLAGGDMLSNELTLLHLANCVSDAPFSLTDMRREQQASRPDGVLQRTRRCTRVLPGRGMAFLPFWPEAAEAVQKLGFRPLAADATMGSLEPAAPDTEDAAAKPGRGDAAAVAAAAVSAAAVAAAAARQDASPAAPPQWTPPVAGYPTPPVATGATPPVADASPGSFWEVLNAEICSPELDAAAGTPAMPPGGVNMQQQQQLAPPPPQQHGRPEPTVQGLPLPPGMQAQQQAQQLAAQGLQHQISGPGSVVVHTARVVADQKVMGHGALVLGVGTVHAMLKDAAAAQAIGWPPELHIAKTLARAAAESFLDSKRSDCLLTRLKIQFTTAEAETIPRRLLATNAAGAVTMPGNFIGVLLPKQHPTTQQILLQLVVVPQG